MRWLRLTGRFMALVVAVILLGGAARYQVYHEQWAKEADESKQVLDSLVRPPRCIVHTWRYDTIVTAFTTVQYEGRTIPAVCEWKGETIREHHWPDLPSSSFVKFRPLPGAEVRLFWHRLTGLPVGIQTIDLVRPQILAERKSPNKAIMDEL